MYQSISFYIGTDTLVLNDHTFRLGDITTEVLNITPEEYDRMKQLLDEAEEKLHLYRHTRKLDDWRGANKLYIRLDDMLCSRQVFRLLKLEPCILQDAEMLFAELDQTKLEGFDYPPRYDLIFPGSLNDKWIAYEHHCKVYSDILDDIFSFNYTIQRFLYFYLSRLKKLDPENYAAALYSFLYEGPTEKLVANPFGGSGLYSNADPVKLRFVPRLIDPKNLFIEMIPYIKGQVIMTSHNTMLMEAEFARNATYILSEEDAGHKVHKAISDYDKRTYQNNNIRNKYLNNDYGGLPQIHPINFGDLIQELSRALK